MLHEHPHKETIGVSIIGAGERGIYFVGSRMAETAVETGFRIIGVHDVLADRARYAAEHLASCARLAGDIPDFGAFETHDAYVARLKEEHGRKFGFWSLTAA